MCAKRERRARLDFFPSLSAAWLSCSVFEQTAVARRDAAVNTKREIGSHVAAANDRGQEIDAGNVSIAAERISALNRS